MGILLVGIGLALFTALIFTLIRRQQDIHAREQATQLAPLDVPNLDFTQDLHESDFSTWTASEESIEAAPHSELPDENDADDISGPVPADSAQAVRKQSTEEEQSTEEQQSPAEEVPPPPETSDIDEPLADLTPPAPPASPASPEPAVTLAVNEPVG